MLICDILGNNLQEYKIIIHATDVDPEALEKAKTGIYTSKEVNNVPNSKLRKYFRLNNRMYEIKPELKKMIRFNQHDLIKGAFPGKFDLVVCRNVFIFFETKLQKEMLQKLYSSLKKEGLLLLGKSEMLHQDNLFECISTRLHIYKKKLMTKNVEYKNVRTRN